MLKRRQNECNLIGPLTAGVKWQMGQLNSQDWGFRWPCPGQTRQFCSLLRVTDQVNDQAQNGRRQVPGRLNHQAAPFDLTGDRRMDTGNKPAVQEQKANTIIADERGKPSL